MLDFDQSVVWRELEMRQARTNNPRHRQLLQVVINHGRAEVNRDLDALMATLVAEPEYHFCDYLAQIGKLDVPVGDSRSTR